MKEEEIKLDDKVVKIITKLPKENLEDNRLVSYLDDTIDMEKIVKEIKEDDKKG